MSETAVAVRGGLTLPFGIGVSSVLGSGGQRIGFSVHWYGGIGEAAVWVVLARICLAAHCLCRDGFGASLRGYELGFPGIH